MTIWNCLTRCFTLFCCLWTEEKKLITRKWFKAQKKTSKWNYKNVIYQSDKMYQIFFLLCNIEAICCTNCLFWSPMRVFSSFISLPHRYEPISIHLLAELGKTPHQAGSLDPTQWTLCIGGLQDWTKHDSIQSTQILNFQTLDEPNNPHKITSFQCLPRYISKIRQFFLVHRFFRSYHMTNGIYIGFLCIRQKWNFQYYILHIHDIRYESSIISLFYFILFISMTCISWGL